MVKRTGFNETEMATFPSADMHLHFLDTAGQAGGSSGCSGSVYLYD